jgi:predicted GIY-YIG superfamily endonuclease
MAPGPGIVTSPNVALQSLPIALWLIRMPKKRLLNERWFVYLLRCADGSLYTGIAKDVTRRCRQHNAGTASKYTRSRLPVALAYQEVHRGRSAALKREAAIKSLSKQAKEAMLAGTLLAELRATSHNGS